MKISLKSIELPEFVQITIARETKRILTGNKLFILEEKEDIIQELILFYCEHFHRQKIPHEAYVVTALKNKATKLRKTKASQGFGLFLSLDNINDGVEVLRDDGGFPKKDFQIFLEDLMKEFSQEECQILNLIKEGYSLDEIARKYRSSKNTIYKIFEKIKKNYKK